MGLDSQIKSNFLCKSKQSIDPLPHLIKSNSASWRKIYWSCKIKTTSFMLKSLINFKTHNHKLFHVFVKVSYSELVHFIECIELYLSNKWETRIIFITCVCTINILSCLSLCTQPYTSNVGSFSATCCNISRAINVPVLPIPALK